MTFEFNLQHIMQTTRSNDIFYKVVKIKDFILTLQCINSASTFDIEFQELIKDEFVLSHLYPVHACYAGVLYSKLANNNYNIVVNPLNKLSESLNQYTKYQLYSKERDGSICFQNKKTKEVFKMELNKLINSNYILREFSAKQSFYLGIILGIENNFIKNKVENTKGNILSL